MKDIELPPLPERDTSKPAEEQGVFRKFDVRRTDGSSEPGGKHHGCEYFVLDVDHDPAAHAALAAYADAIEATHPVLAADMRSRYGLARAAVEADRAQRVPDGWKLVPVEPTEEMLCAGDDVLREAFRDRCIATRTIYDAMLASTPATAQQEPSEGCDQHWSYYFKVMGCKAKTSQDDDCICWHTEGTGPFDMVRHDDADQFLEWRESPSSAPAPAQQEPSETAIAQIDREIKAMLTQVESGSFPEFPARTLELAREVAKLIVAQHQEPPQQERKPMTELHINRGSADAAADLYAAEYWSARAQEKADSDRAKGALQPVSYYVHDAIMRLSATTESRSEPC